MKFCIRIINKKNVGYESLAAPTGRQLIFFKLKMGSRDSASPHASFILTRKYFFIVSFTSVIYNLLSRYSNARNLNLCLLKGALSGLRKFLAIESPLKLMKNAFYFISKALFVLKIFKFLS